MQPCLVYTIGELLVEIMRPETNVPLSVPARFEGPFPSGAPAIFIDAVAKLGVPAGIVGAVGRDAFGRCLVDRLRADGVDTSQVAESEERTTGMAFVTYSDDGSRDFLFHMRHSAAVDIPTPRDYGFLDGVRALHVSGTALTINDSIRDIVYRAVDVVKAGGGFVTFDPNLRPELAASGAWKTWYAPVLARTDVLLPSGEELEWLAGVDDPEEAVRRLHEAGIRIVFRKMGEAGSAVYADGRQAAFAPGFAVEAVDPTGAGDCYSAGVVYGMLQGWSWEKIASFANAVGALSTTKLGPMEGACDLDTALAFIDARS